MAIAVAYFNGQVVLEGEQADGRRDHGGLFGGGDGLSQRYGIYEISRVGK